MGGRMFMESVAGSPWCAHLMGANQLPLVVEGIKFTDGVAIDDAESRAA